MPHSNVVHSLLELLKVKHNSDFTRVYFDTYPSNTTLWAIHNILIDYGIKSVALKVDDKDQIHNLSIPFIVHIGDDFCVVKEVSDSKIKYIVEGKEVKSNMDNFFRVWTGVVLLPEATDSSIEPNYRENKEKYMISKIIGRLASVAIALVFLIAVCFSDNMTNIGWCLLLLLNILNLGVSYTLLMKENYWENEFLDKLCSASKGFNCDSTTGKRSKLFGIISWSEIGVSYFLSNIAMLVFIPASVHLVAIISVLVLPYIFWSIWYQKYKEKRWCTLCIATQILLFGSFLITILYDLILFREEYLMSYICSLLLYPISLYLVTKFVEAKRLNNNYISVSRNLNSIKWDKNIFESTLNKNHLRDNAHLNSNIIVGNRNAKNTITIFSNPYCSPCAKLESFVPEILKCNSFRIQYVFVPLITDHVKTIKTLISAILNAEYNDRHCVIEEWYSSGILDVEAFALKHHADASNIDVQKEYRVHSEFANDSEIKGTPKLLFNGYLVSQSYSLIDIYQMYKNI